jgi:hypothetical protein
VGPKCNPQIRGDKPYRAGRHDCPPPVE